MAIVIFLHVMIAIALVNTLSIEFIFSSAPTVYLWMVALSPISPNGEYYRIQTGSPSKVIPFGYG